MKGCHFSAALTVLLLITAQRRAHHGKILAQAAALVQAGKLRPLLNERRFSIKDIGAAHAFGYRSDNAASSARCAWTCSTSFPRAKSRVPPPLPPTFSRTCLRTALMSLPAEGCWANTKCPPSAAASSATAFSDLEVSVAKKPRESAGTPANTRETRRQLFVAGGVLCNAS